MDDSLDHTNVLHKQLYSTLYKRLSAVLPEFLGWWYVSSDDPWVSDRSRLALESNGPPKSIDFEHSQQTAVLDGGKKEVTQLNVQAGRYAFICFLPDRDEPTKPHYQQGLLKEVTVPAS